MRNILEWSIPTSTQANLKKCQVSSVSVGISSTTAWSSVAFPNAIGQGRQQPFYMLPYCQGKPVAIFQFFLKIADVNFAVWQGTPHLRICPNLFYFTFKCGML
jgi:hypothetical protein